MSATSRGLSKGPSVINRCDLNSFAQVAEYLATQQASAVPLSGFKYRRTRHSVTVFAAGAPSDPGRERKEVWRSPRTA